MEYMVLKTFLQKNGHGLTFPLPIIPLYKFTYMNTILKTSIEKDKYNLL